MSFTSNPPRIAAQSGFVELAVAPEIAGSANPAVAHAMRRIAGAETEAVILAPPAESQTADTWRQTPTWQSAIGARARVVEGAVVAAICVWFAYGGARVLGLL